MVDGLYCHNEVYQFGIVMVYMFQQFSLGVRWTCDENGTRVSYRLGNAMQKVLILCGVPAADGIRLMMDMPGRVMGM